MDEEYSTKDIVERLDQLIAIMKLSNADKLDAFKKEISKDEVLRELLTLISDQPMDYSTIVEKVVQKTGKSDRTVQSRISELVAKKILYKKRVGSQTLYFNSGLLE